MNDLLNDLISITRNLFSFKAILYYLLAILLTYIFVQTGLDWAYLKFVTLHAPRYLLFVSDIVGFLIPIFLPITIYILYKTSKRRSLLVLLKTCLYSIITSFIFSIFLKALTGRVSPPHHGNLSIDNSHDFMFGFMRHDIIGGWPSSHATIAFALAASISILYPRLYLVRATGFGVALFIGVGITFGFHWLSELMAGALFGMAIGEMVGRHFQILPVKNQNV